MDFCRLFLELVGRGCEKSFASAKETQFTGFAAGLVQDALSGQGLSLGARSEAESTRVGSLAKGALGLFRTHAVHPWELGKSFGIHHSTLVFRLLVLACLYGGFEGFNVVVEALGIREEDLAVDFVPIGCVLGWDDLALSMRNVSFDEVDPKLFSLANDLGGVVLNLALEKNQHRV